MYLQNKFSASKVKFRHASDSCEIVLEAAKLAYGNKTGESITSHKLGTGDFWRITNSVFNKVNLLYLLYFMTHEMFSFAFDKALLFAKNFSKNSHHDD